LRLYKYTRSKYTASLLDGAIRFQPLSYFQQYEDNRAVGDPHEARRLFRPQGGLVINNITRGTTSVVPASFLSSAQADRIFVYCVSLGFDEDVAREFGYDSYVEILDGEGLSRRLKTAIATAAPGARMFEGAVQYYEDSDPPGINWALPEVMVLSKRAFYASQWEYRFAFGPKDALELGSTVQKLVFRQDKPAAKKTGPVKVVQVGDIRDISRVRPAA
jgi:hypothetical protein